MASTGQGFTGYNMFVYCLNSPINCKDDSGNNTTEISIVEAGQSKTVIVGDYILTVTVSFESSVEVSDSRPGVKVYSSYNNCAIGSDSDQISLMINGLACIPSLDLHINGDKYSHTISANLLDQSIEYSFSVPYDSGTLTVSVKVASNKHPSAKGSVPAKNESTHRSCKFRPSWKQIAMAAGLAIGCWIGGVGGPRLLGYFAQTA